MNVRVLQIDQAEMFIALFDFVLSNTKTIKLYFILSTIYNGMYSCNSS